MKYIRTKDGRLLNVVDKNDFDDEEKAKIPNDCTMVYASNMFGCSIISNKNIVKQADTIEELCDEFVVYVKDNIKAVRIFPKGKAMEYSTYLKQTDNLDSEIYGAIFTDKGLIYVVKMNDKGEFELL